MAGIADADPLPDPNDPDQVDAAWEDKPVSFAAGSDLDDCPYARPRQPAAGTPA